MNRPTGTSVVNRSSPRGQAYTLEAIIAGMLVISALIFALQVTAVTPLSASTSSQHIENQQKATAEGVLAAAQEDGNLKDGLLFWNNTAGAYYDAERRMFYTNTYPDNEFGAILDRSFAGRGLAVNVAIYPEDGGRPLYMVNRGTPSDNAVTASTSVTIYSDDNLTAPGFDDVTVEEADTFHDRIPESEGPGTVHNVVRVEVTVWRM